MSEYTAEDVQDLIREADARLQRSGYSGSALYATDEDLDETADLLDRAAAAARELSSSAPEAPEPEPEPEPEHDEPKGKK